MRPRESSPEVVQGPRSVTTSPTLLGPVFVGSQQNYSSRRLLSPRLISPQARNCPVQNYSIYSCNKKTLYKPKTPLNEPNFRTYLLKIG